MGAGRWRGWWLVLACCLLLLSLAKASVDSGSESDADLSPTTSSAGLSDGGDVELLLEEVGEEEGGEEAVVEREEPVLIVATVVRAFHLPFSTPFNTTTPCNASRYHSRIRGIGMRTV